MTEVTVLIRTEIAYGMQRLCEMKGRKSSDVVQASVLLAYTNVRVRVRFGLISFLFVCFLGFFFFNDGNETQDCLFVLPTCKVLLHTWEVLYQLRFTPNSTKASKNNNLGHLLKCLKSHIPHTLASKKIS